MATAETVRANGNGKALPMRGKKKRKGNKRIPRRTKTVHKTWNKIDGALQENILTLLCFDTESCPEIISQVPVSLFDSEHYRTIADRAIKYYRKYAEAAGDHLPDLFEDLIGTNKKRKDRLYGDLLCDLHDLKKSINSKFVLDELHKFVRQQSLKQMITLAAEELQQGHSDAAERLMAKGLKRIERPAEDCLILMARCIPTEHFANWNLPPSKPHWTRF